MFDASKIFGAGFNHHVKNSSFGKIFRYFYLMKSNCRRLKHGEFSSVVFMEQFDRSSRKHSVLLPGQWHHHCYFNLRLTKILSKITSFTQDLQMLLEQGNHSFSFPLATSRLKIRRKIVVDLQSSSTVVAVGIQILSPKNTLNCAFLPQTDDSSLLW